MRAGAAVSARYVLRAKTQAQVDLSRNLMIPENDTYACYTILLRVLVIGRSSPMSPDSRLFEKLKAV